MKSALFTLLLLAAPALSQTSVETVIAEARADCTALGGTLSVGKGTISRPDLDGDGRADTLVDTARLSCSAAASLFCGTGGCGITTLVGSRRDEFLARGWKLLRWDGKPILLLAVHGSECGGIGADRCVRAVLFTETGPRTIAAPQP